MQEEQVRNWMRGSDELLTCTILTFIWRQKNTINFHRHTQNPSQDYN